MNKKYLKCGLYVFLTLLLVKGFINMYGLVISEWKFAGYGQGDRAIFLAIGRAILNGLTPYHDLFENKPPGIFLLAATSLWWNDDVTLVKIFQILSHVAIPASIALTTYITTHHNRILTLLSLSFGVVLAQFSAVNAGTFFTESFGAVFALLYVCVLAVKMNNSWNKKDTVISAFFIAASLGFKEQFIIILLVSALVFTVSIKDVVKRFVVPLAVAFAAGVLFLGVLGFLDAYLFIYAKYILTEHNWLLMQMGERLPTFKYGLMINKYVSGLRGSVPFFIGTVTCLWMTLLLPLKSSIKKNPFMQWGKILLLFYLTVLVTQMAGHKGHHQVIALPLYAAAFFWMLQVLHSWWNSVGLVKGIAVVSVLFISLNILLFATPIQEGNKDVAIRSIASTIDTVMDRCDYDRYFRLSVIEESEYAFMKHSQLPNGLIQHFLRQKLPVDLFRNQMRDSLEKTELILVRDGDWQTEEIVIYLQDYFTQKAPDCAGVYNLPEHLGLLFRKLPHGSIQRSI